MADFVTPSQIPWDRLRGKDLEECVFWLVNSMGAKDLVWRVGGRGEGAADQGRHLECVFYVPTNTQFRVTDLLRQAVYSRLAGYEDLNDAARLSTDPTFRLSGSPSDGTAVQPCPPPCTGSRRSCSPERRISWG
jgi:hypothetical protein